MKRRGFLKGAAALAAVTTPARALAGPPAVHRGQPRPVVIASANGHLHKAGGERTCVEETFLRIARGEDVLDAIVAGVRIVELDPDDTSVGYGGLPNSDGVVQLDASVMHGPLRRAGAVAALEGVRTPAAVAREVMHSTDHHLLVGSDAREFARRLGFPIEADLNTDRSRALWLEWKRRTDPDRWLDPAERAEAGYRATRAMAAEGLIDRDHMYGTIHCSAVNARAEICGCTTTSGLAWKIPGRVGDSPILGAGLYVDGRVGAAGSTGRGEANLYNLTSYLIVENLRAGMAPKDAALAGLRRIRENTVERRLLDANGNPDFNILFYVLDARGRHAGVSMWEGRSYAICTERGGEIVACESLLEGTPAPRV
jgi:N4-(beta-N-acetylglucosaminyl)-L-asparaginase